MILNPLFAIDFYKADHRRQYPEGTTEVYSNFTARSCKKAPEGINKGNCLVTFFGLQYFIKHVLIDMWNEHFFNKSQDEVVSDYKLVMDVCLGKDAIPVDHIKALHELGYLPLRIKALPEGSKVEIGIPMVTVVNTHPDFFWLTNYIESVMASYLWKPCTVATIANRYWEILVSFWNPCMEFSDYYDYSPYELSAHDFSFRGTVGRDDAILTGMAHLTSFRGTDSVLGVIGANEYYNFCSTQKLVAPTHPLGILNSFRPYGESVPATEHSVMCAGGKENEFETFKRLITEVYPTGIVSIVSDTWDLWKVIGVYLPLLKDEILKRDGKVVIRPDSGDPVKIICGDPDAPKDSLQYKGVVESLFDIFGGNRIKYTPLPRRDDMYEPHSDTYHNVLDSHIGVIYGDSITLTGMSTILSKLIEKYFSPSNVIFGIGSYSYQYLTRDTFGFAMKATSVVINGKRKSIFKNPITDDGGKTSAQGLLCVRDADYCAPRFKPLTTTDSWSLYHDGLYLPDYFYLYENVSEEDEKKGKLKVVFEDGELKKEWTFDEVKSRVRGYKPNKKHW